MIPNIFSNGTSTTISAKKQWFSNAKTRHCFAGAAFLVSVGPTSVFIPIFKKKVKRTPYKNLINTKYSNPK